MRVRFPPLLPTTRNTMKLKPTDTYVMSKPVKTLLAGIHDSQTKSDFKKLMIEAELVAKQKAPDRSIYLLADQKQPGKPKAATTKPK